MPTRDRNQRPPLAVPEHATVTAEDGPPWIGTGQPRATPPQAHLPASVPEGTVVIEVYDPARDMFGRVRFFAYWREDIRWRGGGLVAGQVFRADEREFAARHLAGGGTVVYLGEGGEPA